MPSPPDIDRILRAVDKLEIRLKNIVDHRSRLNKVIATTIEQIEQAHGDRPTQAELDHDDKYVEFKGMEQDFRRDHAIGSLSAVVEFVSRDLERPDLDHALHDLWLVLTNAAAGSKGDDDWLTRRPTYSAKGAPRLTIEGETMRGAIAAVQQVLMDGGLKREAAARFARRHFPRDILDPLLPDSPHADPGWKTVAEWRGSVIRKNPRESHTWRLHSFRRHGQIPVSGETPEQRALSLIDTIIGAAKTSD